MAGSVRQENVQVNVEINGKRAGATMAELEKNLKAVRRELRNLPEGSEEFIKKSKEFEEVNSNLKRVKEEAFGVGKAMGNVEKETGGASEAAKELSGELGDMIPFNDQFSKLGGIFGALSKAVGGSTKATKLFRLALISTGLGAIVVLLGSFVAWLTKTQKGMDFVKTATAGVSAAFNVVIERLITFGKGFLSFVTGDFKEGVAAMKDSVTGIGSEIASEFAEASEIEKQLIAIEKQQSNLAVTRSKNRGEIERLKLIAEDLTKSEEERLAAAEKAFNLESTTLNLAINLQQQKIALLRKENEMKGDTRTEEDLQRVRDAEIELAELREDSFGKQTELNNKRNELRQADLERQKAANQEKLNMQKELHEKEMAAERAIAELKIALIPDSTEREIAEINLAYEDKIAAIVGNEQQITEQRKLLEQQRAEEIKEIRDKLSEQEYEDALEKETEKEEEEKLRLEEKFLLGLETDAEHREAKYEIERAALESKAELVKQYHGEESLEYLRANNELLALEKAHADQILENERRTEELKANLKSKGFDAARGFLQLGIELMGEDEEARKKNAKKIKAFQVAEVTMGLVKEIQGIWAWASGTGPWGAILGAVLTGIAAVRGGMAIDKIQNQKFALGGLLKASKKYALGGIVRGRKHSEGGVPFYNPSSGTIDEMEGDEIVLTGGVSRDPRLKEIASAINVAAGGRMFAAGGPVNPYRVASEAGVNGGSMPQVQDTINQTQATDTAQSQMLLTEVRGLRSDVQNLKSRLKAYIVYSDLEDAQQEVAAVRSDASIASE